MPKQSTTSAKGFDRLAGLYDAMMEWAFWGNIAHSQTYFLKHLPQKAKVLVLGGGTGWIVEAIWKVCPTAHIVYVELSPKMLSKTKKRIPKNKTHQIQLVCGDIQLIPQKSRFDVICTFFFLDLFPPQKVAAMASILDKILKINGLWLYADFEAEGKRHWLKKSFIRLMYLVCSAFCTLENKTYWQYPAAIKALGYKQKATKTFFRGLIRAYCFSKKTTNIDE